jgi:hypothetical protein
MSEFYSLPPYQHEHTTDLTNEYYRNVSSVPLPTTTSLSDISRDYSPTFVTGPFPPISQQLSGKLTTPPTTEPLIVSDIATTQSLVAALQATMTPKMKKPVVVIPGARKRSKFPQEATPSTQHMHLRLRHGIVLGTIFLVLLTTLLSLAPLDNGQSSYQLLGGVIEWVQAQQQNWNIPSHLIVTTQNQNASQPAASPQGANPPAIALPQSAYIAIARQDAIDVGISPDYFVRQIELESGFNPNAVSPMGAVGIAQFLPGTAAGLGIDPWNPVSALRGAAQMMANSARQYGGDYAKALAAYNAGSGTVDYAVNACGTAWMTCLPPETRHYIYLIMGV